VASFLLVYFGIRSYRAQPRGKFLSAGRCCGILIALITCICYVAMWESSTSTSCALYGQLLAAQIHRVQSSD